MKVKTKVYAAWRRYSWDSEPTLTINSYDITTSSVVNNDGSYTSAGQFDIELDVTEYDPSAQVNAKVAALRREQGELTAKATECGRKIAELLALPCEVAPM